MNCQMPRAWAREDLGDLPLFCPRGPSPVSDEGEPGRGPDHRQPPEEPFPAVLPADPPVGRFATALLLESKAGAGPLCIALFGAPLRPARNFLLRELL